MELSSLRALVSLPSYWCFIAYMASPITDIMAPAAMMTRAPSRWVLPAHALLRLNDAEAPSHKYADIRTFSYSIISRVSQTRFTRETTADGGATTAG